MKPSTYKALTIGPDGWAHGVQIGRWLIDRPDFVLDPSAERGASTEIEEVVDADDCDAMIRAYEEAGKPLLVVDADHSVDRGDSTAAYFWVADMRRCEDGIEILLQPTDLGETAVIKGRRWRFLSPVFPWQAFKYDDADKRVGHPRCVTNWGLTNFPRMRQIRPVVNAADPAAAAVNQETQPKKGASMDYKQVLCALLGLDPATATDADIQSAVDAAQASAAETSAAAAMNAAGIPDDPAVRGPLAEIWKADAAAGANAVKAAAAAVNAANAAAAAAAKAAAPAKAAAARALHTEQSGKTPAAGANFRDKSAAVNSVLAANPGMSRSQAYGIAKQQSPELFG